MESRVTKEDFPLKPWHTYYDWNLFVAVDGQYGNLLSVANTPGIMECEWDTAFFPSWAWPQRGQRVWLMGRWIYDCGHPDGNGWCKTEIHPPRAVVSFRSEAVKFAENTGPVRANNAVVYIGRKGGYWTSPINDRDYEFTLPLPPRPKLSAGVLRAATARLTTTATTTRVGGPGQPPVAGAVAAPTNVAALSLSGATRAGVTLIDGLTPVVRVSSKTGALPVQPQITMSTKFANALDVKIPLKGQTPHPDEYGVIISCGWLDRTGDQSKKVVHADVTIDKIYMDANLDTLPFDSDEWYVYVGVNGRWRVWTSLGGDSKTLNYRVGLDLHEEDLITISVCGFEADTLHDLMGKSTGIKSEMVSEKSTISAAKSVASTIRDKFAGGLLSGNTLNENDGISTMFIQERSTARGTFTRRADGNDYRLRYTIS